MQNMYFAFQKSGKMRPSRRKKKSFSRTQKNIGDKTGEALFRMVQPQETNIQPEILTLMAKFADKNNNDSCKSERKNSS